MRYAIAAIGAIVLSFVVHEFAHWLAGTLLGYEMRMTLNAVTPIAGKYQSTADAMLVSAAGPLITIAQAAVAAWCIAKTGNRHLYPLLFGAAFMRIMAFAVSFFRRNDEARISEWLGIGWATLPAIVCVGLVYLTWRVARAQKYSPAFNLLNAVYASVAVTGLVFADQWWKIRIL